MKQSQMIPLATIFKADTAERLQILATMLNLLRTKDPTLYQELSLAAMDKLSDAGTHKTGG